MYEKITNDDSNPQIHVKQGISNEVLRIFSDFFL